ncbi:hypothetical protein KOAAANKH_02531 [Brevundimonas sp. NIBR10]|uniref:NUMOD3 domain-containing DNA-binding protein n=1 Tax=Brevundimonas sp. NIBR10 TaxID=3015997 RepID=UPI0022F19C5C|nr:NUMOD3 domain-containing DNA-binding protein [Brevundimonas sp. NIBR10]WGM47649.1 hypothetical protein KOAAANKH_02531 [Brevundimonas sp. NIBR10]
MAKPALPQQCIYAIRCFDGRHYVGSTIRRNERWARHKSDLACGRHENLKLLRAWQKHGADAFEFVVLEEVHDRSVLVAREQHWMDLTECVSKGFNMKPKAENFFGYKHTAETRAKYSASKMGNKSRTGMTNSPEARAKMSAAMKGRVFSAATLERMSAAAKGHKRWVGKRHRAESIAKMSAAKMGSVPVVYERTPEHRAALSKHMSKINTGAGNPNVKITEADVLVIRKRSAEGEKRVSIASDYGISAQAISRIARRTAWASVA